jgi:hypothetical protein
MRTGEGARASTITSRALLRGHRVKRRRLLLDVFAAAPGTAHFLAVVFMNSENLLEGLFAFVADVIVYGHETPPVEFSAIVPLRRTVQSCEK